MFVSVLTLILYVSVVILNKINRSRNNRDLEPSLSIVSCFFMVTAGFLNQGVHHRLNSLSTRAQFLVALLFGYTMYTCISAVLVSQLAVSDYPTPFTSLNDAVNKEMSICCRTNSIVYKILKGERNSSAAWAKYLNGPTCPGANESIMNSLCTGNNIIFESNVIMTAKLLKEHWKCGILILGDDYLRRSNVLIMSKRFQQRRLIHFLLERIRGNGILNKLHRQWVPEIFSDSGVIEVTFLHVKGILKIYVSAVVISLIVFLLEFIIYKWLVIMKHKQK